MINLKLKPTNFKILKNVIKVIFYRFKPTGLIGMVILSPSNISSKISFVTKPANVINFFFKPAVAHFRFITY